MGIKDRVYPGTGSERMDEGAVGLEDMLLISLTIDRGVGPNVIALEICVVDGCLSFSVTLQTTSKVSLYILNQMMLHPSYQAVHVSQIAKRT